MSSERLICEGLTEARLESLTPPGLWFLVFQFRLAMLGGFNGARTSLEIGFLNEVAPALMPI